MFKNYVRIAFRNLRKQKGYSFISISGMAAGMAACLLIFMYVSRELSYDRHQPAHDRVFRIAEECKSASSTQRYAPTPFPLAPAVLQDFPDVEAAARVLSASGPLLESGEKKFYEKRILLVDGDIFRILSLPLVQGDPKTALDRPNTIVVTERAARKFFGQQSAMGKIVKLNNNRLFEITGVLKDPASPSHLSADWFASLSTLKQIPGWTDEFNNWHGTQVHTYVKLKPGVNAEAFEKRVGGIADKYVGSRLKALGSEYRFFLQPIAQIHLKSNLLFELDPPGSAGVLSLLSAAAAFILIIACLNFVGLATARAARRAREVGLRKVVGAERTQLIIQFLGESVVIALLGVLAAVILAALSLRIFNRLAGTEFTTAMLFVAGPLLFMGVMGLAAGLGAGSYPALVLSAFQPVRTLKGIFRTGRQGILTRQILVVGQVILSVVLIAGTAVIGGQIRFMKNQDLGYSKEQLLVLPVQGSDALQETIRSRQKRFSGCARGPRRGRLVGCSGTPREQF